MGDCVQRTRTLEFEVSGEISRELCEGRFVSGVVRARCNIYRAKAPSNSPVLKTLTLQQ